MDPFSACSFLFLSLVFLIFSPSRLARLGRVTQAWMGRYPAPPPLETGLISGHFYSTLHGVVHSLHPRYSAIDLGSSLLQAYSLSSHWRLRVYHRFKAHFTKKSASPRETPSAFANMDATPPSRVEPLNQSRLSTEAIIAIVGVFLAVLVPITGFLVRKIMLRPVVVTQLQYTAIDDDVDEELGLMLPLWIPPAVHFEAGPLE
ncbi:hypothetical protein IWZ00DRAFT_500412 [Phyllosticta capitalensis]